MPRSRRPSSPKAMLDTLTDARNLPAFVARLAPGALKELVDDVGIADAGPLIEHASAQQIAHLLEESIWASATPGDPERLSIPDLLRWLDVWIDLGDAFAAEKLFELGADFCALAFSKLVFVTAVDLDPHDLDETSRAIGGHLVKARYDDEWEVSSAALGALWSEYPDFLETLLERLCFRHSILHVEGENDQSRTLDADASHARERRREESGYVTAAMASAFLASVAQGDIDAIAEEPEYDLETAQYFVRRAQLAALRSASAEPLADTAPEPERSNAPAARRRGARAQSARDELDALERELEQYQLERSGHTARLAAPESAQRVLPLREALALLATEPERLDARTTELSYLSNLLIEGATLDDERLRERDAADAVLAICNLGGSYLRWLETGEASPTAEAFADALAAPPGLVRLFRIGWHLLARLPLQASAALAAALDSKPAAARLAAKPWVKDEVHALLHAPELTDVVRARRFGDAKDSVKLLGIALEAESIPPLCLLIDGVPRFSRLLDRERSVERTSSRASFEHRHVESMRDLLVIDAFLRDLGAHIRL